MFPIRIIQLSIDFFSSEHGILSSPPPAMDPMNSPLQKSPSRSSELPDSAPPPLASAVLAMPRCNVNLVKLDEPRSHIKLLDNIPSIPISVPPVTSPVPSSSKVIPEDDEKSTGTVRRLIPRFLCIFEIILYTCLRMGRDLFGIHYLTLIRVYIHHYIILMRKSYRK